MRAKMWMSYIDVCNVRILLTTISSINLFNNNAEIKTIFSAFWWKQKREWAISVIVMHAFYWRHINNQYITLKNWFDKLTDIISYIKIKLSILSLNIIQWSEYLQLETWAICCGLRSQCLFSHIETYLRPEAATIDCGLSTQWLLIYISWLRLFKCWLSHDVIRFYVKKINTYCT